MGIWYQDGKIFFCVRLRVQGLWYLRFRVWELGMVEDLGFQVEGRGFKV